MWFDDLGKTNSMTKYPSILTYHGIGERGRLTDEVMPLTGCLSVTEKIDGVNGRILLLPGWDGDYIIGSREELLYARGDRIANPTLNIVAALKPFAERLAKPHSSDFLFVVFAEVYGRGTTAGWKQYGDGLGMRVFDVMILPVDEARNVFAMPRDRIALWRDHGNQTYLDQFTLSDWAYGHGVELVPHLKTIDAASLPVTHEATLAWLHDIAPKTYCPFGESSGRAEGVVLRSSGRHQICKIRFEDYERTLRMKTKM